MQVVEPVDGDPEAEPVLGLGPIADGSGVLDDAGEHIGTGRGRHISVRCSLGIGPESLALRDAAPL